MHLFLQTKIVFEIPVLELKLVIIIIFHQEKYSNQKFHLPIFMVNIFSFGYQIWNGFL